ncbi:MAG TPA: BON domain-containing protein [Bryobacteraceae bacterium]|jgi:osmotically-inducible protein OsmY|nr:BON domain-containing protein [Bryobacteraceae bacterium]
MKRFFALTALAGGLCAQALFGQDAKSSLADNKIQDQVRIKLTQDQDVKGGALDVLVKDGVVTLKGRVDTDHAKTRAGKLAKKVKGVKDVDNELIVGPPVS